MRYTGIRISGMSLVGYSRTGLYWIWYKTFRYDFIQVKRNCICTKSCITISGAILVGYGETGFVRNMLSQFQICLVLDITIRDSSPDPRLGLRACPGADMAKPDSMANCI